MPEFDPEIWIPEFIKLCYTDDLKKGNRNWSNFPDRIAETVYAVTPMLMDYETWMLYTDENREKMRTMWSKYAYKKAKKFVGA
jgi:hypothetical protein